MPVRPSTPCRGTGRPRRTAERPTPGAGSAGRRRTRRTIPGDVATLRSGAPELDDADELDDDGARRRDRVGAGRRRRAGGRRRRASWWRTRRPNWPTRPRWSTRRSRTTSRRGSVPTSTAPSPDEEGMDGGRQHGGAGAGSGGRGFGRPPTRHDPRRRLRRRRLRRRRLRRGRSTTSVERAHEAIYDRRASRTARSTGSPRRPRCVAGGAAAGAPLDAGGTRRAAGRLPPLAGGRAVVEPARPASRRSPAPSAAPRRRPPSGRPRRERVSPAASARSCGRSSGCSSASSSSGRSSTSSSASAARHPWRTRGATAAHRPGATSRMWTDRWAGSSTTSPARPGWTGCS